MGLLRNSISLAGDPAVLPARGLQNGVFSFHAQAENCFDVVRTGIRYRQGKTHGKNGEPEHTDRPADQTGGENRQI